MGAERRVWVVDDSDADAARARDALMQGYAVEVFRDGAAVIEHAAAHTPPDVIVLDWVMPGVSGLDVCRFLRTSGGERSRVGILLLSAHRESSDVVEGLEAGANDYLVKPYADPELRARVDALVRWNGLVDRARKAEARVRERVRRFRAQARDDHLAHHLAVVDDQNLGHETLASSR
jgi:two-component system phosphate regulon sensor histidine kinase PhoR